MVIRVIAKPNHGWGQGYGYESSRDTLDLGDADADGIGAMGSARGKEANRFPFQAGRMYFRIEGLYSCQKILS